MCFCVPVSVCVLCLGTRMWVHAYVWAHGCVHGGQRTTWVSFLTHHLPLLKQGFLLASNLSDRLGCPANESQGFSHFRLSRAGITMVCYHIWLSCVGAGIEPSFSCLHGKHFTELAICTGPGETVFFFFKHIQVAPEVPLLSGRYGSLYVPRTPSVWP